MSTAASMRVRVGVPHFFRERSDGAGYGSSRPNSRLPRSIALSRCLHSLLALARHDQDLMIDIGDRCLRRPTTATSALPPLQVEVHVFTDGQHQLAEVLEAFRGRIELHQVELEDPRHLALVCRDHLIAAEPTVDLTIYCEDDLVVHDPLFFDKQLWFLRGCQDRAVLMPHRYEPIPGGAGRRLLVDGPLRRETIERFYTPEAAVGRGRFQGGDEVVFDRASNPHSGLFCINAEQVRRLRDQTLPRSGFVGPLETAATLTVMQAFTVLKPCLAQRDFLLVEHGHPSFLGYLKTMQIQPQ